MIAGATTGLVDLIRAGLFAIALLLLSAAVVCVRPRRLQVIRAAQTPTMRAGRSYRMDLIVNARASSWLPVQLSEFQTFNHAQKPSWQLERLTKGTTNLAYSVEPAHRGEYLAGPLIMSFTDPLGLVSASSVHGSPSTWVVWPHIVELHGTGALRQGEGEEEVVSAHSHSSGYASTGIREYAQGDDIRAVHWPATAHRGELMVRQFDPPARPITRVMVQGDIPTAGENESWEALLSLAASTCLHFRDLRLPISACIADDHFTDAQAAVDAIARVTRSAATDSGLNPAPTLLFHHTSAPERIAPPPGLPNVALVAGETARSVAEELNGLGWHSYVVEPDHRPTELLTATLETFGALR